MKTMCKVCERLYECARCGHQMMIKTNHDGECYSWGHYNTCPKCPPYAKYPEFGGSTVWKRVLKTRKATK